VAGTLAYALGEGWSIVDALHFAVSTLTTTSVADPSLVLEHGWTKVFTVLYLLIGIGILVELLRRLGQGFVAAGAMRHAVGGAGARGAGDSSFGEDSGGGPG
jgi:hypothetical protein